MKIFENYLTMKELIDEIGYDELTMNILEQHDITWIVNHANYIMTSRVISDVLINIFIEYLNEGDNKK